MLLVACRADAALPFSLECRNHVFGVAQPVEEPQLCSVFQDRNCASLVVEAFDLAPTRVTPSRDTASKDAVVIGDDSLPPAIDRKERPYYEQ